MMFSRKAAALAVRFGGVTGREGPSCRAAMSTTGYRSGWSYLLSAYQPARMDLSAASSPTLDAALLSRETAAESPTETESAQVGLLVQAVEWKTCVEGEGRTGNVSLHSTMQNNVPESYTSQNWSPSHLIMPPGVVGRRQQRRSMSEDRILVKNLNSWAKQSSD